MIIRRATVQDKTQVFKLFDEFSALLKASDVPSILGGAMFDEIIARKDTMIFVAEEDGELLGLLSFFVLPNVRHGYHRGHVEDFFVSERARRKGVGTRLFEFMKEYCKKNGIRVVKLDSGNELAGAHEFYEKQGGKTTERFFRFDLE